MVINEFVKVSICTNFHLFSYMIVTHDTLINSWNFRGLDGSTVWHGNEHVRNIR